MFFNKKAKQPNAVVNHEGAPAFSMTPQMELYASVATASLSDKFYEKSEDRLIRLRAEIAKNDPQFVAKLAVYTREQMYLRSVPLVLAVELSKTATGTSLVSKTVERVIGRADELTEILAYYEAANKRSGTKKLNSLSKQVQKGLAKAFNKFDEYQFAKYNRDGAIKLRDALFLAHPKAKDEAQQAIFDKIVNNTLETPYTWETELSKLGQETFATETLKKKAFANKWEELLNSEKLGYMALLRNLRNILEAEVNHEAIAKLCDTLANARNVSKAKQLPFRFLAAYRELKAIKTAHAPKVLKALESAAAASAEHIRGFGAETSVAIACDVSGSMRIPISPNSKILNYDIGLMLAMMLKTRCQNVETGIFGETFKVVSVPQENILASVEELYKLDGSVGYATNGFLVIQDLINRRKVADKVIMFTDCQMWNSQSGTQFQSVWLNYKRTVAPNAKLYLFDLAGYGTTPLDIRKDDVYLIAGWSEKVFDVLAAIEKGDQAIELIEKIEL